MAWSYIKGRWWIFLVATVPFVILGIVFVWLHFTSSGQHEWYNSLLLLGIVFILSPVLQMWWTLRKIHNGQKAEKELIARSTTGHATVITVKETGLCTNDVPEVEILLEVHSQDNSTYCVTHRDHVNLSDLSGLIPGSDIAIKIDSLDNKYTPGLSVNWIVLLRH